ncbi:hypothetical protein GUJ93_ZPchr0006g44745 [Zizania palustris]|uniref:CCT domain-containing protein n=1 Tax=Zizania palustris TaxID=103762 RepID=A0A8J5VLP4_ZIZPA|nr:hypothetical protein GUJ93_ZPchr0006g44745 [Zizania palustris]
MGVVDAPCDSCRELRALVHCAQHDARLCLLCDLAAHAAAPSHQRAPLCDSCYAAPADVCGDDLALCAVCAADAARHCHRPAATYTGFPAAAELARILLLDTPSPEQSWIMPNTLAFHSDISKKNCEVLQTSVRGANPVVGKMDETTGSTDEALLAHNAAHEDYYQAWTDYIGSAGPQEAGAFQVDQPITSSSWSERFLPWYELVMQPDACLRQPLSMNDTAYDLLPTMDANTNNVRVTSSSSDLVELVMKSNASLLQPLTMNDTAYDQLPVNLMDTSTNNDVSSELPWVCFGTDTGLLGGSSMTDCQDQEASHVVLPEKSCQDPEKRQQAKLRYYDKKKKRRFGKQIMYASRKATADTRKRVKGRFVKASSEQCSSNENKQPKQI